LLIYANIILKKYPSDSGDLNNYGHAFAGSLASFAPAQQLIYLPDVAHLEWAYQQALHAEQQPLFNMAKLANIDLEQQPHIIFKLNPALSLLASNFPLKKIWDLCQQAGPTADQIDLAEASRLLIIYRRDCVAVIEEINKAEYIFLTAIAAGRTFADACTQALKADAQFDVSACLQKHIANNNIIDLA